MGLGSLLSGINALSDGDSRITLNPSMIMCVCVGGGLVRVAFVAFFVF